MRKTRQRTRQLVRDVEAEIAVESAVSPVKAERMDPAAVELMLWERYENKRYGNKLEPVICTLSGQKRAYNLNGVLV